MTHAPDAPAAVLWDMDGTLTDTEPLFLRTLEQIVERGGGEWLAGSSHDLIGADLWTLAARAVEAGVRREPAAIVAEIVDRVAAGLTDSVQWRPGARELHAELADRRVPMALVTMSFRAIAETVVRLLGPAAFQIVVTGDDVDRGKPDPEAYVRAMRDLGVDPGSCLVIEDSAPGVAAALAAGATVVGVPFYAELPADSAHAVWTTLEGKTITDLAEVLRRRRLQRREEEAAAWLR